MQQIQTHQRRSIRLKGYDYSQAGAYFVTLVAQGRECVFDEIVNEVVNLSLVGQCAAALWQSLPRHFGLLLGEWVVMPNHLHGIIVLGCKGEASGINRLGEISMYSPDASPLRVMMARRPNGTVPGSLNAIMQNYKSVSTRRINALRSSPGAAVWQRNYYEHIIRNEREFERISQYIIHNPVQWALDEENPWRDGGGT